MHSEQIQTSLPFTPIQVTDGSSLVASHSRGLPFRISQFDFSVPQGLLSVPGSWSLIRAGRQILPFA